MFNAGSPNSVSGLRVDADGGLAPLAGSTRPLSAAASGPAQIEFSRDGRALLVTEKATSRIDSYSIGPDGLAGAASVRPSAGATPFGFAFDQRGHLIVSDAFGGAPGAGALSSYELAADGSLATITGVAGDGQAAPCWGRHDLRRALRVHDQHGQRQRLQLQHRHRRKPPVARLGRRHDRRRPDRHGPLPKRPLPLHPRRRLTQREAASPSPRTAASRRSTACRVFPPAPSARRQLDQSRPKRRRARRSRQTAPLRARRQPAPRFPSPIRERIAATVEGDIRKHSLISASRHPQSQRHDRLHPLLLGAMRNRARRRRSIKQPTKGTSASGL